MKDHYDDINLVHYNDFGIAFNWKQTEYNSDNKIQIVFKETGLLLSRSEVTLFKSDIENAMYTSCDCVDGCKYLVQSPCNYINFSMTNSELSGLHDLLAGVCFSFELNELLEKII
jgi:hypothetical protein|tara:strand:+ start:217 stop:561 length:345 start_codon:yes stop_codon:yes gene_type:complete